MIPTPPAREVQSVRTAFRIVRAVQDMDGVTRQELSSQLELAKSTIHNYLSTLEAMGYVVEQDGAYRLGLRFLTHGMAARNAQHYREGVSASLTDIAETISQPAWWIVEELGRGVFVDVATPADGGPMYGKVGKRSYLHTHAPGKAILARAPTAQLENIVDHHGLPVHTRETITDIDALRDDLATVRNRGYAVSRGEAALGVRSVGVAFEGPHERLHGLGVFGYSHDFSTSVDRDVPTVLQDAAAELAAGEG